MQVVLVALQQKYSVVNTLIKYFMALNRKLRSSETNTYDY